MHIDVNLVGNEVKALGGRERERRLRVATWNFSGLGSERKQKEIGELLTIISNSCRSASAIDHAPTTMGGATHTCTHT